MVGAAVCLSARPCSLSVGSRDGGGESGRKPPGARRRAAPSEAGAAGAQEENPAAGDRRLHRQGPHEEQRGTCAAGTWGVALNAPSRRREAERGETGGVRELGG